MASRKYRGIDIDATHIDMAKNLDSVHELIDELRDLQASWNNLSLLGELTNVGAEISDTRLNFQKLACDLTNFLVEQSTRQAVELLSTRAQNSIDILVRNLYERTADIGFLATDPVFTQRCIEHARDGLTEEQQEQTRERMRKYVEKYSVYENIVLLDPQGGVILDMKETLDESVRLEWVKQLVASNRGYAEAFRPLQAHIKDDPAKLSYAWKIVGEGQTRGYILLVFNLQEESEALFSKVMGRELGHTGPEWRVCGVTNSSGDVLISSNSQYIRPGQTILLPKNKQWGIAQIGPVAYLTCMRATRGYQGYRGPGWLGFCMVPLNHAFNDDSDEAEIAAPALDPNDGLIDSRIQGFQNQASQIQKQLNRSIWNGNMNQRTSTSTLGDSFSKTLLWEISRAGENTKALFTQSLANLVQKEIKGFQREQQARAMLAIDLMDRNLYERANDCRWWALTPVLAEALRNPEQTAAATQCLKHIHSLYTVYTNIVLFDAHGKVVCDSAEQVTPGTVLEAPWVKSTLQLKNQAHYCVSEFEQSDLYQNRPTYIYTAVVLDNIENPRHSLGGIALVFDSEPQFEAILNEAMGDSPHRAFAFIVDEKDNVISSTTHLHVEDGRLNLPLPERGKFEKQQSTFGFFELEGRLIAYGVCNSGSYREYKGDHDRYQNNLTCVYGLDVGALLIDQEVQAGEISFDEFRQNGQKELRVDIASFRVGGHWYGIDSEDAVEAFMCREVATLPNSPEWILGTTLYKKDAVTIVDISRILETGEPVHNRPKQQMILLKTRNSIPPVALAVDELGEIPSLPMAAIHESEGLPGQCNSIQGLVKTSDNLLVVLNTEQLLSQLHNGMSNGIKKAPSANRGLVSAE